MGLGFRVLGFRVLGLELRIEGLGLGAASETPAREVYGLEKVSDGVL